MARALMNGELVLPCLGLGHSRVCTQMEDLEGDPESCGADVSRGQMRSLFFSSISVLNL